MLPLLTPTLRTLTPSRALGALPALLPTRLSSPSLRSLSSSPSPSFKPIERLTVFGAGLMGAGIAQVAAQNGVRVVVVDQSEGALDNGKSIIHKSLSRLARKAHPSSSSSQESYISSTFSNLSFSTSASSSVSSSSFAPDLVVEAIVESLPVKQELFRRLDELAPRETVFASNTSSLGIGMIAEKVGEGRKERFAGFHAFNPVPQMKLVEIIATPQTSPATTAALLDLCKRMGKTPVRCGDTPGFIVNRLLVPYLLEALRMVERGDATAEDIDTAMKLGAGVPMGPVELSDFVGLDTLSHIASGWRSRSASSSSSDSIAPALVEEVKVLEKLVKEGKTGRKSGEGFFDYRKEK
ncbi:hypothetical protein JCM8547_008897 [Rhodosporidiobolus lusitaniae]